MSAEARVAIAVFARSPEAGFTKTRLIPRLGAAGAAQLQRQLIERALSRARALPHAEVTLWATGADADGYMRVAAQTANARLRLQRGADLGERMGNAFADVLNGSNVMVLIGTDCPAQQVADLRAAVDALVHADAVVQPAEDGGYVAIGMRRPLPVLFEGVAWGSGSVLETTRQRAREHGIRLADLAPCWDLDRSEDLDRALALGLVKMPTC